ncbi:MAG: hypothetical protein U5N27_21370 [Rhizobium sp.]|nr:hypothetical protein [Rhizobium sp.]
MTREASVNDNPGAGTLHHSKGRSIGRTGARHHVTQQSKDFFRFIPEDEQAQLMDILRRAYPADRRPIPGY